MHRIGCLLTLPRPVCARATHFSNRSGNVKEHNNDRTETQKSVGAGMTDLTRTHVKRLRFYWQNRGRGGARNDGIDLDLEAAGLIIPSRTGYDATPAGVQALADDKARTIEKRSPHNTLASRMAAALRLEGRVTWENIEFMIDGHPPQAVRPDVYSLVCTKNVARIAPTVHEVKVSRSDFLADLANPDKRGGYFKIAARLVYVAPLGIIDPAEVPDSCGLVEEVEEGRFRTTKRAKSQKVDLPPAVFLNLILKSGEFNPR